MIASRSCNFIFIKTRKTGSTSVEIVLSSWCSGDDICTPIMPEDEVTRLNYGGKAQNYRGPTARCYNHMPAAEIREVVPDLWAAAFKFTVERHPYEKVISRAWWNIGRRQGNPEHELKNEIERAIEGKSYLNHPLYSIGDGIAVNEIVRYEEMWPRLGHIAARLGKRLPSVLPKAKGQYRLNRQPAAAVLTAAQKAKIFKDAEIEFRVLGYDP